MEENIIYLASFSIYHLFMRPLHFTTVAYVSFEAHGRLALTYWPRSAGQFIALSCRQWLIFGDKFEAHVAPPRFKRPTYAKVIESCLCKLFLGTIEKLFNIRFKS